MTTNKLDAFTRAYIDAALWSSTADGSAEQEETDPNHEGTFDTSFQALNFDANDLSPELLAHVIEDCAAFQKDNAELLASAEYGTRWPDAEMAGHDFWLTRNHHGAGFWGRGLGDVGRNLTDAAHAYGDENWYLDRTDADSPVIRHN